jgi:hypothetical protein
MADWVGDLAAALANRRLGQAGRAWEPDHGATADVALEVAHWRITSYILAQGIVLTTLLGRCALAEAEGESAYSEYLEEVAAAAEVLVADWQELLAACRRVGVPAEQIVGEGKTAYMTRSVVHLAQEIVGRK